MKKSLVWAVAGFALMGAGAKANLREVEKSEQTLYKTSALAQIQIENFNCTLKNGNQEVVPLSDADDLQQIGSSVRDVISQSKEILVDNKVEQPKIWFVEMISANTRNQVQLLTSKDGEKLLSFSRYAEIRRQQRDGSTIKNSFVQVWAAESTIHCVRK